MTWEYNSINIFSRFTQLREDADCIYMQEKLHNILSHIKKLLTQIGGSHPVATGHFFSILCYLPWLLIKIKQIINQIAYFSFTNKKTLQPSRSTLVSEVPSEGSYTGEGGDNVLKAV